jgi:hypothetical protein
MLLIQCFTAACHVMHSRIRSMHPRPGLTGAGKEGVRHTDSDASAVVVLGSLRSGGHGTRSTEPRWMLRKAAAPLETP